MWNSMKEGLTPEKFQEVVKETTVLKDHGGTLLGNSVGRLSTRPNINPFGGRWY
jgi:hypothetical protein